ncbi:hypothetical protein MUN74_09215 [Agromyces endophyticus]|uniref:hypothetical protein n=1 Tax=Agromyces sp. H17E-10 TaxID=2932244 RepID=UPI001FD3F8B5|nr:hypothetical protein [Agromyces sp. H17E-10]UOQ91048.1 hypothetical protein MUN74_09215 [Agromyces sp. H17E-10]
MSDAQVLTPGQRAAVAAAIGALPQPVDAPTALDAVPQIALLATHADAAAAYPTVVRTAERAELDLLAPAADAEPAPTVSRAHVWLSVIAAVVGIAAPALIMIGRTGNAALDPVSGALPSGLGMAAATVLFWVLEPKRTQNPLYHGGNFGARMYVFFPIVWAIAIVMVLGEFGDVSATPAASVGLLLQVAATIGCIVLAVVAFRHDRERPDWAGGRRVQQTDAVPAEIAASSEFVAGMRRRLDEWRRYVFRTSTPQELAALLAAELEALDLLRGGGVLDAAQFDLAERRVRSRSDWR